MSFVLIHPTSCHITQTSSFEHSWQLLRLEPRRVGMKLCQANCTNWSNLYCFGTRMAAVESVRRNGGGFLVSEAAPSKTSSLTASGVVALFAPPLPFSASAPVPARSACSLCGDRSSLSRLSREGRNTLRLWQGARVREGGSASFLFGIGPLSNVREYLTTP